MGSWGSEYITDLIASPVNNTTAPETGGHNSLHPPKVDIASVNILLSMQVAEALANSLRLAYQNIHTGKPLNLTLATLALLVSLTTKFGPPSMPPNFPTDCQWISLWKGGSTTTRGFGTLSLYSPHCPSYLLDTPPPWFSVNLRLVFTHSLVNFSSM